MAVFEVMRIHQWLKNLLLLVPLLTAKLFLDFDNVQRIVIGFIGFSLLCSSNYIWNDLMDLEKDKLVLYKSKKPLASGRITKNFAIIESAILLLIGISLCWYCSKNFALIACSYLVLGLVYTRYLKRIEHVNVVTLVLFYEIRVFAGGVLTDISISFWLAIFSFSIFSSLAFLKQYSKVQLDKVDNRNNYLLQKSEDERSFLILFGVSFAVVSLLTFGLYLNSSEVQLIYNQPKILWILIPMIQFLLLRIWKASIDGKMHYDPIVFILKDLTSSMCLLLMLMTVILVGQLK